jgi:hypothetical protein
VDLPNAEDAVRRRMRRQQFANTLAIMVFALGIVVFATWLVERGRLWHRPAPPQARHEPKPMAARPRPAVTAPPAPVEAPASVAQATAPGQEPAVSQPVTDKARPQEREVRPRPIVEPMQAAPAPASAAEIPQAQVQPAPGPAARSPYDMPGANGATRVLVGIKCTDDFRYEGEARGRQYFSARCESGSRRSVSCVGGGCKIEYAPPPSHLP